jgi:hypothetical protein
MQQMYCYDHTNLVYSVAFYINVIYLNLMSCKVHHLSSGACTLGRIVANLPHGLSLTPPPPPRHWKLIKGWSLNKGSILVKCDYVWCVMTYPWWHTIVAAAGLFQSDPEGSSRLMTPWLRAFQATGHCTKSLLFPGFVWAVDVIWTEKEIFSDCSILLKIAKWGA